MKKRKLICFAICVSVTMTGIISGCSPKKTENPTSAVTEAPATEPVTEPAETKPEGTEPREIQAPSMTREEFPKIDGSTATIPLSTALYQLVTGATAQEAEATISHTKTTNAYIQLLYETEKSSLVLAYEPSAAVYDAMKELGVNLILKPIGKDALVFMANEGNPVESLTEQQLVDIYSGNLKNWSKVGGEDKEIMAFQRPENSGSQTLMEKLVMKDVPMDATAPVTSVIGDMGELIEKVAAYNNQENALGYSVYFYARNMYEKPGLRFMKVNGVLPSNETIKSGAYPYVNEFYAAIREDEPKDSKAYELFEWLTNDDGQALIESLGYVGMETTEQEIPVQKGNAEVGEARIQFEPNERLLLDGQYAYGADGVVVLDDQMNITQIVRGVRLPNNVTKIRLDEPVILNGSNAYTGLYDLITGTWLVQPEYSALYKNEDGTYGGYKETKDRGSRVIMTPKEGGFEIKELPDNLLSGRIWEVDAIQKKAVIKTEDGTVINQVDFRPWGDYSYGYVQEPYYVADFDYSHFMLFDPDGNPLFHKSFLPEAFMQEMKRLNFQSEEGEDISLEGASRFGSWVCGMFGMGENNQFLYDIKKKKVITEPGDKIEPYYFEEEDGYLVTRGDKTQAYSSESEPLISDSGRPYEYAADHGYYGYQEGETLILENPKQGKTNTFRASDVKSVNHICGDVFGIETGTGKSVYKGNTCLMEGKEVGWWSLNPDYSLVTDFKSHHILLDQEGNIIYESHLEETIIYLCEELMAVRRGNYLHIIDYEGRSAMRLLLGNLGDD